MLGVYVVWIALGGGAVVRKFDVAMNSFLPKDCDGQGFFANFLAVNDEVLK
jgi:hypothetical protein